ncbi:cytochrome P450 6k1-like isoform X2 [Zootermopsis nevadensis]|uniref:cytochrome P450 6k1-like isoform X2 n=1 Tax=Zootermopsis nevadensis TaxID=136037 RepID=UPI000B8E7451|nr:cytochrome P450 6k1-like isoform X2 [Zootermopsis nevadensis]
MEFFETAVSALLGFMAATVFILYWFSTSTFHYWKNKGVKSLKPSPLFGNIKHFVLCKLSPSEVFQDLYNKFDGERYGGIHLARKPVLLIRDPELMKHILLKDFAYFPGKGNHPDLKKDPLSYNLFNLEGEKWKYIRTKLTPAFTPGKLKIVYQHIDHYSEKLIEHLEEHAKNKDIIDMYNILVNFTMDATGSCAFGVEANAMDDEDSAFKKMGHRIIHANGSTYIDILESIFPILPRFFRISTFPRDVTTFFQMVIKKIMEYREQNHIMKKDVMHLLMLARNKTADDSNNEDTQECLQTGNEKSSNIRDEAQAAMFLRAGSEKASTAMSFCLNELALQPALQSELRAEIEAAKEEHSGKLTYETVLGLKLLDRVVSETLRKYPLEASIFRVCKKPYNIPGTSVQLDKGTRVLIPVYALHHDPKYYPEPERFDPDRFTDINKSSRQQFTYLPFGEGPRVCIGFRYGMLQVKVGLAALLLHYEFSACHKTKACPELNTRTWITSPASGMWLRIHERK